MAYANFQFMGGSFAVQLPTLVARVACPLECVVGLHLSTYLRSAFSTAKIVFQLRIANDTPINFSSWLK